MELFRALAVLAEPVRTETEYLFELLELGETPSPADFTDLFVFQLYPYASVYLGEGGMLGGEARDRVAGFWHALGETPPNEPDHLAVMLALYARLAELDEQAEPSVRSTYRHIRHAFFWEHLASWLPVFLDKLSEIAPPPYRRWGELLKNAVWDEASRLGPAQRLPLHLRQAPSLPDSEMGAEPLLSGLLAPVQSGVVLTRNDLARAARELKLGLRTGERRFALRALIEQDPEGTMRWLRDEAAGWVGRHRRTDEVSPAIAEFWVERAARTASILDALGRTTDLPCR